MGPNASKYSDSGVLRDGYAKDSQRSCMETIFKKFKPKHNQDNGKTKRQSSSTIEKQPMVQRDDGRSYIRNENADTETEQRRQPCCHLVGSIPLSSTKEVLRHLSNKLPHQIRRIPDGETGERNYFVWWQQEVFKASPFILRSDAIAGARPMVNTKVEEISEKIKLNPVRYDEAALASYGEFCRLREAGIIASGVRYQVCLPTPINAISLYVDSEYQAEVEVLYENLLLQAVRRIQDNIPKEDLAIQWDIAMEMGMLEGLPGPFLPWFSPLSEGITERVVRFAKSIDAGVEMGFHFCYGDMEHKHFVQPKDSRKLVEIATSILNRIERPVDWLHMPVPKDRLDIEYYLPLKELNLRDETELYLGLVHAGDESGTRQRMELAKQVVIKRFGVATECGMGRTPPAELDDILEIMAVLT